MDTTAGLVCSFVATFDERVGEFSLIVGFLLIVRFLLVSLITSPNHQHSASGIYLFFKTTIESFNINRRLKQWKADVQPKYILVENAQLPNVSDNMGIVISDPPQVSPSVPRWN